MDLRSVQYFVAVAEELHFGRAAARLHISQPPLSRRIKQLESHLGCVLLHRSPTGVALTPAGARFYHEARDLLAHADQVWARAAGAEGVQTLTIGIHADTAERVGPNLVTRLQNSHPGVRVRVREADLTDPTAGLRSGLVDVALTRTPFDDTGIASHVLRADPIAVVMRADDPLAGATHLRLDQLAGRSCYRMPEGVDPVWRAFWNRATDLGIGTHGPVVRTIAECKQSVLWNGSVGLMPMVHGLPTGLTSVPLQDSPPSLLAVAWTGAVASPLIRSFVQTAATDPSLTHVLAS